MKEFIVGGKIYRLTEKQFNNLQEESEFDFSKENLIIDRSSRLFDIIFDIVNKYLDVRSSNIDANVIKELEYYKMYNILNIINPKLNKFSYIQFTDAQLFKKIKPLTLKNNLSLWEEQFKKENKKIGLSSSCDFGRKVYCDLNNHDPFHKIKNCCLVIQITTNEKFDTTNLKYVLKGLKLNYDNTVDFYLDGRIADILGLYSFERNQDLIEIRYKLPFFEKNDITNLYTIIPKLEIEFEALTFLKLILNKYIFSAFILYEPDLLNFKVKNNDFIQGLYLNKPFEHIIPQYRESIMYFQTKLRLRTFPEKTYINCIFLQFENFVDLSDCVLFCNGHFIADMNNKEVGNVHGSSISKINEYTYKIQFEKYVEISKKNVRFDVKFNMSISIQSPIDTYVHIYFICFK